MKLKVKLISCLISLAFIISNLNFPLMAETLDEYKERMEKERQEKDYEEPNSEGCNPVAACCQIGVDAGCLDSLISAFFSIFSNVIYAAYPFDPEKSFNFASFREEERDEKNNKFWMGLLEASGNILFGQELAIYGAQALSQLELTAFNFNLFFQYLIDNEGTHLITFSVNGGLSIPLRDFILSLYAGILLQEGFPAYFSWGASLKIFLKPSLILSCYSLFTIQDGFYFIIVMPSFQVALNRFTFGIGFDYYNYNALILYGPSIKLTVWY